MAELETGTDRDVALDFALLDAHTCGDAALARDVLALFIEQAHRLAPLLPSLTAHQQSATAHLLRGSCQGIGATSAAGLLSRYEAADPGDRDAIYADICRAFAEIERIWTARLAAR